MKKSDDKKLYLTVAEYHMINKATEESQRLVDEMVYKVEQLKMSLNLCRDAIAYIEHATLFDRIFRWHKIHQQIKILLKQSYYSYEVLMGRKIGK